MGLESSTISNGTRVSLAQGRAQRLRRQLPDTGSPPPSLPPHRAFALFTAWSPAAVDTSVHTHTHRASRFSQAPHSSAHTTCVCLLPPSARCLFRHPYTPELTSAHTHTGTHVRPAQIHHSPCQIQLWIGWEKPQKAGSGASVHLVLGRDTPDVTQEVPEGDAVAAEGDGGPSLVLPLGPLPVLPGPGR